MLWVNVSLPHNIKSAQSDVVTNKIDVERHVRTREKFRAHFPWNVTFTRSSFSHNFQVTTFFEIHTFHDLVADRTLVSTSRGNCEVTFTTAINCWKRSSSCEVKNILCVAEIIERPRSNRTGNVKSLTFTRRRRTSVLSGSFRFLKL